MVVAVDPCVICCWSPTKAHSAAELLTVTLDPGAVRTSVYAALGSDDGLLYVGVTATGTARFTQHASDNTHWWLQTTRLIVRHFACRHDALDVEAFLIRALDPEWNTVQPKRDFERGRLLAMREHFEDDLPAVERFF